MKGFIMFFWINSEILGREHFPNTLDLPSNEQTHAAVFVVLGKLGSMS